MSALDSAQAASAAQFDSQSERYGRSHILADTSDLEAAFKRLQLPSMVAALDIATGGGHTALFLARRGYAVSYCDVAEKMVEATRKLLATEEYFPVVGMRCPAENIPCPDALFTLVTCRVAPHHFSSIERFLSEVRRLLLPGGTFLMIDGTVPEDEAAATWLNKVEKWRDTSHGRLLSQKEWLQAVHEAGLQVVSSEIHHREQPDLEWYFETANTNADNRQKVLDAVESAEASVREHLQLETSKSGTISWRWPMLTLVARRQAG